MRWASGILAAAATMAIAIAPPASAGDEPLPGWADYMEAMKGVAEPLIARTDRGGTEELRQDMYRYILGAVATGYLNYVNADPARPTWSPLWNHAFNYGGPNPDYAYMQTLVDPGGVYRISGFRGTSRFVEITQQADEFMSVANYAHIRSSADTSKREAPPTNDLDSLRLDKHGWFSVILSAKRPEGYDGDWWRLDPGTHSLLMRKTSYDWRNETDPRIAIDRLDEAPPLTPEQISQRLSRLKDYVTGTIDFDVTLARYYRDNYGVNTIKRSHLMDSSNNWGQVYYDGGYEIADDEALILETDVPETCRYWQTLVADNRFATVDWVNHQSSLNGHQARIDSDGRFRAVISAKDPGVPNWLDTAGNAWGIIQLRWNRCSSAPDPTVRKVLLKNVRKHLPADTPAVTPAERKEQLRLRREAAQLRQLW